MQRDADSIRLQSEVFLRNTSYEARADTTIQIRIPPQWRFWWRIIAWVVFVPLCITVLVVATTKTPLPAAIFVALLLGLVLEIVLLTSWFLHSGVCVSVLKRLLWSADCWLLVTFQAVNTLIHPIYLESSPETTVESLVSFVLTLGFVLLDSCVATHSPVALGLTLFMLSAAMVPAVVTFLSSQEHLQQINWLQPFKLFGLFPTDYRLVIRFQTLLYLTTLSRVFFRAVKFWRTDEALYFVRTPMLDEFSTTSNTSSSRFEFWCEVVIYLGVPLGITATWTLALDAALAELVFSLMGLIAVSALGGFFWCRGVHWPTAKTVGAQLSVVLTTGFLAFNVFLEASCAHHVAEAVFWAIGVLFLLFSDALCVKSTRFTTVLVLFFISNTVSQLVWYGTWSVERQDNCVVFRVEDDTVGTRMYFASGKVAVFTNCLFLLLPGILEAVYSQLGWASHYGPVLLFVLIPVPRRKFQMDEDGTIRYSEHNIDSSQEEDERSYLQFEDTPAVPARQAQRSEAPQPRLAFAGAFSEDRLTESWDPTMMQCEGMSAIQLASVAKIGLDSRHEQPPK